jgi:DNA-binding response OmpR family regulator
MKQLKVLIAEDDREVKELYKKGLPDYRFEKVFVEDGKKALSTYESWKPDIVILDIIMPNMYGFSVLEKIRREHKDYKTTVIMATALGDSKNVERCLQLGIQGYLIKPFDHKKITQEVLRYHGNTVGKMIQEDLYAKA